MLQVSRPIGDKITKELFVTIPMFAAEYRRWRKKYSDFLTGRYFITRDTKFYLISRLSCP